MKANRNIRLLCTVVLLAACAIGLSATAANAGQWDYCGQLQWSVGDMPEWCVELANDRWDNCTSDADYHKAQCDSACAGEEPPAQAECYDACEDAYADDMSGCQQGFCDDMWYCYSLIPVP